MSGYALSTVESRYQSLAFSRVLGIAVLAAAAAVCGGNAEAQEAVKSPDVYAAMKAGFPDNFDALVANKTVVLFKSLVPVLVSNGTTIKPKSSFDAKTAANRNQQYACIAYAMRGNGGSAYQIKDASGKVVATALIPSEAGSDQVNFNISQDGSSTMTVDVSSPGLDAANAGGGGGGGGGGAGGQ